MNGTTGNILLVDRVGADGTIALLTMNRPEARNAMSPELRVAISDALKEAEADPEVQVVILTGAGTVFCAGMDLKSFAQGGDMSALTWFYHEGISKPVIAALNGPAVAGGFELALAVTKKLIRERRWGTAEETHPVFGSADAREGAIAFAEKRPPAWTGK